MTIAATAWETGSPANQGVWWATGDSRSSQWSCALQAPIIRLRRAPGIR